MTIDDAAEELTRITEEYLATLPPEERKKRLQAFFDRVDKLTSKDP